MIIRDTGHMTVRYGDNLAEAVAWLKRTPATWRQIQSRQHTGKSWDMGASWDRALTLARDGWQEGIGKLNSALSALPPMHKETKTKYDVAGYEPDVGRYLGGAPDHMIHRGRDRSKRPTVHLLFNGWVQANVKSVEYENFGLALASAIDRLENAGKRVEIDMVFCGEQNGMTQVVGWKLKKAKDHLDLAALAYSTGHVTAFRRLGFAMMERSHKGAECYGYGRAKPVSAEVAQTLDAGDAFIIEGVGASAGACVRRDDAVRFVAAQINKAAGETLVEVELA